MRKIAFLFYALFFGLFVTACGGGHPAENAAVSFYSAIMKGDTEKAISLWAGVDLSKESEKGMAKGKMEMVIADAKEKSRKKGGFLKVSVDSDTPSNISENSATVHLIFHYGDNSTEKESVQLKKENNQWKVAL